MINLEIDLEGKKSKLESPVDKKLKGGRPRRSFGADLTKLGSSLGLDTSYADSEYYHNSVSWITWMSVLTCLIIGVLGVFMSDFIEDNGYKGLFLLINIVLFILFCILSRLGSRPLNIVLFHTLCALNLLNTVLLFL